jgi:uncharacterized protein (TIGR02001 family)
MKKLAAAACAALALSGTPALSADMRVYKAPPAPVYENPFDIAFGGAIMSDYNFRGISQSNNRPSVYSYFEGRYNLNKDLQLYAAIAGESVSLPNRAAAEIDIYAGIRPTFGKLSFDFGAWYYLYPGGQEFGPTAIAVAPALPNGNVIKRDLSYYEVFGKTALIVNDYLTLGASVWYSPSWLNSGADGTYLSGTFKATIPSAFLPKDVGAFWSGELAHYWLGTTDAFYGVPAFPLGVDLPDYTTWNIGLAFTWKVFTLDLRYHDTDRSRADCNVLTGDHTATFNAANITATNPGGLGSRWCGPAGIVKLAVDLTVKDHLK